MATSEHKERMREQVKHFFHSKDERFLKEVFFEYAQPHNSTGQLIQQVRLSEALAKLGIAIREEELLCALKTADPETSGGLGFEGFKRIVEIPTKLEEWASALPLAALLGRCLSFKDNEKPLKHLASLTTDELQAVVEVFSEGVGHLLKERLNDAREVQQKPANCKFQTYEMDAGNIRHFFEGLGERVGAPHPDLEKGMRQEHCEKAGQDYVFETSNYGVKTTPSREYKITLALEKMRDEDKKDRSGAVVREERKIHELKEEQMVKDADLRDSEIAAVVYNSILRRYPRDLFEHFKDNQFPTTIHVLVSATIKLSRTQRLPSGLELYRGMGGKMTLPAGFYQADKCGVRGCMEWGFLSTTSDKSAAVQYSGVMDGAPLPMLLRLTVGSVDRPACIHELSQYPGEREYLFMPCSFLEPVLRSGRVVELCKSEEGGVVGAVEVVAVRINANLKGQTVEELEKRKKQLHLDAFRHGIQDLERRLLGEVVRLEERFGKDWHKTFDLELWLSRGGREESLLPGVFADGQVRFTGAGLVQYVLQEAQGVLKRHEDQGVATYNRGAGFRCLNDESLRTLEACDAVVTRYLEDQSVSVECLMRQGLNDGLREFQMHLWRRALPATESRGSEEAARGAAGSQAATGQEAAGREAAGQEAEWKGAEKLAAAGQEATGQEATGQEATGQEATGQGEATGQEAEEKEAAVQEAAGPQPGPQATGEEATGQEAEAAAREEEAARQEAARQLCVSAGLMDATVEELDAEGLTPLMRAAAEGAGPRALRALVRAGACVNRQHAQKGSTALFLASKFGHAHAVEELARLSADVNLPAYVGFEATPAWVAAEGGHVEVIEALGRNGADLQRAVTDGRAPLFRAAEANRAEAVLALHRLKADVNAAGSKGRTPLTIATKNKHAAVIDVLKDLGAH